MPVVLLPHNNQSPLLYNREKERILKNIPTIYDIHHVGSTAVPGLSGKNIVDILIGLNPYKELENLTKQLEKLGYITKWIDYKKQWTYLSTKLHGATQGDFHIHILKKDGNDYKNMLMFRDYLTSHIEEREKYEKLKPMWQKDSKGISMAYAKLKTNYIENVLQKVKK